MEIAIIDSGINPDHPHVKTTSSGWTFSQDSHGQVIRKEGQTDHIGHGTAIAGIIHQRAPSVNLVPLKIFHESLKASGKVMLAALQQAVSMRPRIIHLSLGTIFEEYLDDLSALCQEVRDQGNIVVAAAPAKDAQVYPAAFGTVIGVYWHPTCQEDDLVFHTHTPVNIGAHGWPRPLPGLPRNRNFRGSSFAAAHVTSRIAELITMTPDAIRKGETIKYIIERLYNARQSLVVG